MNPRYADPNNIAFWFSSANIALLEITCLLEVRKVVLDIEHGIFDLKDVDAFVALAKAMNMQVYAKVLAPEAAPIQQALDFGADAVVVPHILGVEHAREICAYSKFPPLGKRSFAGGRTVAYGSPEDDFFATQNNQIKCYPMIETEAALSDIDAILALDTVEGVFVGPSDLALSRRGQCYQLSEADKEDIQCIAQAATVAEKPWIMPAWTGKERAFVDRLNPEFMVVGEEQGFLSSGATSLLNTLNQEALSES